MQATEMQQRLAAFLASKLGVATVDVCNLRRLAGGASRETWSVDVCYEADGAPRRLELVLRRDPAGSVVGGERRDEFGLLQAAAAAGVPVPRVRWLADEHDTLGAPFFLMDRIAGETIARRLLRDDQYRHARQVITGQLGAILAAIHRIDYGAPELRFLADAQPPGSPAAAELQRYEEIYRAITPDPHPAFELAFRWLQRRLPPASKQVVVHGDFRIGNIIFGPEGVRAVLDWELSHLGDAMEDLGWICVRSWRFGSKLPVGGIGERAELFAAYEAAGGAPVDADTVHFWEVLGNLKWGIMTIMQAKSYLDGSRQSVELASIGRRTAETEFELMELMKG